MTSRVVILDDDPTGTQCAADVTVALDPASPDLAAIPDQSLYVLTNTRAVGARQAAAIVAGVRDAFAGQHARLVLRGDSTLRGHIAAEMNALRLAAGVGLIVPAYPAAGRVTIGGVHYLDSGRVNVADSEFARDPVFGYRARTMADWAREVGLPGPVTGIGLDQLSPQSVRAALLEAADGTLVVPDVRTDDDIAVIAEGFAAAADQGRHIVVRCAAPLAAAVAGTPGRIVGPPARAARRLLVVCGSHTAAATRQVEQLAADGRPVRVLTTAAAMAGQADRALARQLADDLDRAGLAVLVTERIRRAEHGTLKHAGLVMAALMRVVRSVADDIDAVVSKGGITSAETAISGLGGCRARVRGQIATGVPLWDVTAADGRVVPQAVVPGNVGDDATLIRACAFFLAGSERVPTGGDL
jgi:uncharacterized protein YgbK (DUF1537 family)